MPITLAVARTIISLGLFASFISTPLRSVSAEEPSPAYLLGVRFGWALQSGAGIYRFEENQERSTLVDRLSRTGTLISQQDPAVYFFFSNASIAARTVEAVCPTAKAPPSELLINGVYPRVVHTVTEPGGGANEEDPLEPLNPEPLEPTATATPITDFVGGASFAPLASTGAFFLAAIKTVSDPQRLPPPGPDIYDYLVQHGVVTEGVVNELGGYDTVARIGVGGAVGEVSLSQDDVNELAAICAARSKGLLPPITGLSTQFGRGILYALTTPAPPALRPSVTLSPAPTLAPIPTRDPAATPDSGFAWVCYEGKTWELPPFLLDTYLKEYGATSGRCP